MRAAIFVAVVAYIFGAFHRTCVCGFPLSGLGVLLHNSKVRSATHRFQSHSLGSSKLNMETTSNESSGGIRFVTNKMCPFAQRTWIALLQAGMEFAMVEINLYGPGGKPGWFLRLNPRGEVPVLDLGGGAVVGSEATLDHVAAAAAPELHPPGLEQEIKEWRRRTNEQLLPIGKRAVQSGGREALTSLLEEFDASVTGPFLTGEQVTVADISMFPMMQRVESEFGFPQGSEKLRTWFDSMMALPAVSETCQASWWWWW